MQQGEQHRHWTHNCQCCECICATAGLDVSIVGSAVAAEARIFWSTQGRWNCRGLQDSMVYSLIAFKRL